MGCSFSVTVLENLHPKPVFESKGTILEIGHVAGVGHNSEKADLATAQHQQGMLKKSQNELVFILSKHVKQTRPNYPVPPVIIPRYTQDEDICPYACLEEYMERTKSLRHDDWLFISIIKPHKAIGYQRH